MVQNPQISVELSSLPLKNTSIFLSNDQRSTVFFLHVVMCVPTAKGVKDHDSSGDSDTAGKRIVEKLRSDVKGLKNALRRSRRGTRTKESMDGITETSVPKTQEKNKHCILRRMSHVQSSDECEINNDIAQSPIGAGLPLLQRYLLIIRFFFFFFYNSVE